MVVESGRRVRLSVQDTALSRLKDGFDSRTRYHLRSIATARAQAEGRKGS